MSRKDYILIADVIKLFKDHVTTDFILEIAQRLHNNNDNFNKEKFLEECIG